MKKGPKNVVSPGKTRRRIQAKVERHTQEKVVRKEWRQSKEGSKVTFTHAERLFMKLMKGANEEDWKFLANFERDDHTRVYDNKIRCLQCRILGRGVTF